MFAERLKRARAAKKFSRKTVAFHLGIIPLEYKAYENGECDPSPEILARLCKLLDVSQDWLFGIEKAE